MGKEQRHTISYLSRRFAEIGFTPNRRHGQNFLVDVNLVELIARSAKLTSEDVVLEVGTGTGSLTSMLARQAAAVVTVEVDQHLWQVAAEELEGLENVTMLQQDVLKSKNHIHANVQQAVMMELERRPGSQLKLVANLPYSIATPLISNLLLWPVVPSAMTVTIQKELADRLMAGPSTKDYGALSVWVQSLCEVSLVRVMPPGVFWPAPKVHSAIIQIEYRPDKRAAFEDLRSYHGFVRSVFFHRRKFLRSVAVSAFKGRLSKSDIDEVLADQQLGAQTRAEELTVQQIQRLYDRFEKQLQASA